MSIPPTAIIDPSAKIGNNVIIDPYVVIGRRTVIGDNCHLLPHTYIQDTEMGTGCKVYPQVSLGLEPQHLADSGEEGKVIIGDNCVFRESTTVHRGTKLGGGVTRIGNDGFFMALSHIAHDCLVGNKVIMANMAALSGHVEVGNNSFISAMTGIHQFVRIGPGVIISGGSMVPMDVAPSCIAKGDRASIRGLNVVGMRRMGFSRQSMKLMREAYRLVFQSGLRLEEALNHSFFKGEDPHLQIFKKFLSENKRGYIRPDSLESQKKSEAEVSL